MQPTPAPSAGRGDAVLQPAYFTSTLYVQALRDDISNLTDLYRSRYLGNEGGDPTTSCFALFKQLWISEGWKWFQFRVFDDRSREMFLLVTLRLFMDRIMDKDPLSRVVGLFGAYTFYYTQPEGTAPKLRRVNHIPVPIDYFRALTGLCDTLTSLELSPLKGPVLYIVSRMVKDQIFYILPPSELGPENPRHLPREIVVDNSTNPEGDTEGPKKKGRPSRVEKAKKGRAALGGLTTWLESSQSSDVDIPQDDLTRYGKDKVELIAALEASGDHEPVMKASLGILERLRDAQAMQDIDGGGVERPTFAGLERVERAVEEVDKGGVLGLVEGAGL